MERMMTTNEVETLARKAGTFITWETTRPAGSTRVAIVIEDGSWGAEIYQVVNERDSVLVGVINDNRNL